MDSRDHLDTIKLAYERINKFFSNLKLTATQLTRAESWCLIVTNSMEFFLEAKPPNLLLQPI